MLFVYLHLVSIGTLLILYINCVLGALKLSDAWAPPQSLASSLAFVVVSALLWGLHWTWLRRLEDQKENSTHTGHRLYLLGVSGWMVLSMLLSGGDALTRLLRLLGMTAADPADNLLPMVSNLLILALSVFLWRMHWARFKRFTPPEVKSVLESNPLGKLGT